MEMKAIEQLRKLIAADTHTVPEIAAKCGIHRVPLYAFLRGTRSLPDRHLQSLATFYGCEIVLKPAKKRRKD